MLELTIPGRDPLRLEYLVLDVNGTLTLDGQLLPGVAERLARLSLSLTPMLISGDTQGTLAQIAVQLGVQARRLEPLKQVEQKVAFVDELGAERVVAIGNGANDEGMLHRAALGIAVLGPEGLASGCLAAADIIAPSIEAAFDLLLNPRRLIGSLRT